MHAALVALLLSSALTPANDAGGCPAAAGGLKEDPAVAARVAAAAKDARRLKAGDTFYEPARVLHAVSRNPSAKVRTRVLAVILHPRDAKALVVPEPAKGGK
jgi:hypothetical protein